MAPTIRLGTASPGTQATTAETLVQLDQIARRAASKKVDILVLPEAYIGGYPRGTAFGCLMGSRSDEGRDEYLRYFRNAVDLGDTVGEGGAGAGAAWVKRELGSDAVPSSDGGGATPEPKRGDGTREELERIARDTGVFLVVGLIEKAGGSMYCSAVYVCPTLGIIGKRRKVMPTGTERLVWAQGSPATLRAVSTTIRGTRINLAAAICWENYMPLVRQTLYAQNINLYLAPTADGRDTWLPLLRTIAIEGRCFVVSANMCVRHQPQPSSSSESNPEEHQSRRRRNSCVTEEGFEIALPPPPSSKLKHSSTSSPAAGHAHPHPHRHRRRSVFDEDGNEIVLPLPSSAAEEGSSSEAVATPSAAQSTSPPSPQTRIRRTPAPISSPRPEFLSRGGSSIVSPFGEVLAGPQWEDDEGIVYADVDFDDCIRGRLDLDTAGSYSRNDSFKFSVEGLDLSPLPY
ncbi:carbon-nitrogen hydrolase [Echria macrotheca]|uniref:Carbon-nitrogen hydrolase n=1 Tax=Echria macrotheca TaxID=438768 RepID=A0AAJ0FAN1_9PEZI|nr:carbon-nitrogen hydrolase [Echria macrotheca]